MSSKNTISRGFRGGPARMVLRPNRSVVIVTELGLSELAPAKVTVESTGQKAVGLLTVPRSWTLPFFVVSDGALTSSLSGALKRFLDEAAVRSGVTPTQVMVRSNGIQEGLSERGALASLPCSGAMSNGRSEICVPRLWKSRARQHTGSFRTKPLFMHKDRCRMSDVCVTRSEIGQLRSKP